MGRNINGFDLANDEKLERALHGTLGREGKLSGGVGDDASKEDLLVEYDRLGGLITKNGVKVKTGCFYDFGKKCPRKEPKVSFVVEIDGESLEVNEEEAQVLKAAKDKTDALKAKKRNQVEEEIEKPKKKRKKTDEI